MLHQAVRESSGGTARVQADLIRRAHAEILERAFELLPGAAGVARSSSDHLDSRIGGKHRAGLLRALAIDANFAGQNQSLRFLARFRQAALHQQHIQSFFRVSLAEFRAGLHFRQARRKTRNSPSSRRFAARAPNVSSASMARVANSRANSWDFSRPNSAG